MVQSSPVSTLSCVVAQINNSRRHGWLLYSSSIVRTNTNTDSDSGRDEVTEQTDSVWIRSFLQTPKMRDSRERTELFHFLVYTSILATVEKTDQERTRVVLECIRARYFTDSQFYQANIALADIHNVINDIFR